LLSLGAEYFVFQYLLSKNITIKIYKTLILPVVLYGCETRSLTLRDECTLRVCENRVLRGILGPRRDKVTREWRKLHNDKLSDLYFSRNDIWVMKSRRIRWAGHVVCMGKRKDDCRVLVKKLKGRDHLEDPGIDERIIV
jgi:hypothetical protein